MANTSRDSIEIADVKMTLSEQQEKHLNSASLFVYIALHHWHMCTKEQCGQLLESKLNTLHNLRMLIFHRTAELVIPSYLCQPGAPSGTSFEHIHGKFEPKTFSGIHPHFAFSSSRTVLAGSESSGPLDLPRA